jgi:hypothetical protein
VLGWLTTAGAEKPWSVERTIDHRYRHAHARRGGRSLQPAYGATGPVPGPSPTVTGHRDSDTRAGTSVLEMPNCAPGNSFWSAPRSASGQRARTSVVASCSLRGFRPSSEETRPLEGNHHRLQVVALSWPRTFDGYVKELREDRHLSYAAASALLNAEGYRTRHRRAWSRQNLGAVYPTAIRYWRRTTALAG